MAGAVDLSGFDAAVSRFHSRVRTNAERFSLGLAERVWEGVSRTNPLRTGRSSASWNLSKDVAVLARKPRDYYNPTLARFEERIVAVGGFKLGDELFVVNTQPYVWRLERGWSAQRPRGFVRPYLRYLRDFAQRGRLPAGPL